MVGLHIVQIGWDTSVFLEAARSESRQRQVQYAISLDRKLPGSQLSNLVLGASVTEALVSPDGPLRFYPLEAKRQPSLALWNALQTLDRQRPIDLITTQTIFEEAWECTWFARRRHIPVIGQAHFDLFADESLPAGRIARSVLGRIRRRIALAHLPRFTAIRTVAESLSRRLERQGATGCRCIPVPIVDLDRFLVIDPSARERRVLFVGRLVAQKGLEEWITVARRVVQSCPDAQFDIVGDGEERPRLVALAKACGISDHIHFYGALDRQSLVRSYARASVFLLTSRYEGFGRVLVEAMAAGIPLVSTRVTGPDEILEGETFGFLHELGDVEGMASSVGRLLNDTSLSAKMGRTARITANERYAPAGLAERWVEMLIDVAQAGSARVTRSGA